MLLENLLITVQLGTVRSSEAELFPIEFHDFVACMTGRRLLEQTDDTRTNSHSFKIDRDRIGYVQYCTLLPPSFPPDSSGW